MGKIKINNDLLDLYVKKSDYIELESELQRLKVENEELKTLKDMYFTYYKAKHNDVKGEFFTLLKENKHLKKCCTQTGEELEKHSFKWDGKEKNLVVQAMELNEHLEKLEKENERLKESLKIAEGLCKTLEHAKTNEHNQWFNRCCEINTECDKYKQCLKEIKEIVSELCIDSENCDSCNSNCMQKDI